MPQTFVITTNPDGFSGSPLWWTGDCVVGICRANEAETFDEPDAASEALGLIPDRIREFYRLIVAPSTTNLPPANFGTQGWMVGHPGYDLH